MARRFADRIVGLKGGRIALDAKPGSTVFAKTAGHYIIMCFPTGQLAFFGEISCFFGEHATARVVE